MRTLFIEEALESLASMERELLLLESNGDKSERLNEIFRFAHSIKGGAGVFGLADIGELTHQMESLLGTLRDRKKLPDGAMVDVLLECIDALRGLLAGDHVQAGAADSRSGLLARRLRAITLANEEAQVKRLLEVRIGPLERPESADAVMQLFREIPGLGEVVPMPQERGDIRMFAVRTGSSDADLMDLFAFHVSKDQVAIRSLDAQAEAGGFRSLDNLPEVPVSVSSGTGTGSVASGGGDVATIRIAISKVDRLLSLAGDLIDAHEAFNHASGKLDSTAQAQIAAGLRALSKKAAAFQRAVLAIRMTPVSVVFNRFPRMLRELSRKLDKKFVLVIQGETTEVDKVWLEKIADPLIHLVRNSCDHGIETPEERLSVGKPAAGTITLAVSVDDGAVVITVADDGRGLVREKMLRAARSRAIRVPDQLPDDELWQLVFVPGLTTVDAVSDVSGRGVGMDVVQRNVTALGGTVGITSVPGKGARVSMRLPLPAD